MHKHKRKKHHKREQFVHNPALESVHKSRSKEEEELVKLEATRAQLKAELNGNISSDQTRLNAMSLIAQGYGSESEEEGEIEHENHREQLKRARNILEGIQSHTLKEICVSTEDFKDITQKNPTSSYAQLETSLDPTREFQPIDVDEEEFVAYMISSDKIGSNSLSSVVEELQKNDEDNSDVEILEEHTHGPTFSAVNFDEDYSQTNKCKEDPEQKGNRLYDKNREKENQR